MVAVVSFNGVSLDVDPYHIENIEGLLGPPDIRTSDLSRVARDGLIMGRDFYAGRTVTITMSVNAADPTAFGVAVSALTAAFAAPQLVELPLTFTIPGVAGSQPARLNVRPRRLALPIPSLYFDGIGKAVIELFATDALKYSESATTVTFSISLTPGGFTWPFTWDLVWSGAGSTAVVVNNSGNAPSAPVVRFNGDLTNPAITNVTTGHTVSLNLTIVAGDYVELDFAARTVLLNGTANRYPDLDSADWWTLVPGNNSIALTADLGSGNAELTYRSSYL